MCSSSKWHDEFIDLKVAAVVLAAGSSSRLGQPKQSVRLGAETLLERTVRIAQEADLDPIFVVVAPGTPASLDSRIHILINDSAAEGMASSIRLGVASANTAGADAVLILACDQPFVTSNHLRKLAASGDGIVGSAYAGRKGVPAHFSARSFSDLMNLQGDTGARELLREAPAIALNKGELDVDTQEDLERVRELYAGDPLS